MASSEEKFALVEAEAKGTESVPAQLHLHWHAVFGSSRWNISPYAFFAVRFLFACTMVWDIGASIMCWRDFWGLSMKFYFVKWSFLNLWFQTLYHCLAAFLTGLAVCKRCDCKAIRWLASLTCVMQAAVWSSAFMLPYAFLYANFGFGAGLCGVSVLITHGGNAVIMLIDMFLSRQRLYYYRVIWAVGFMSSYMAFSYVYSMNGGTYEDGHSPYVYSWLDWKNNFDQAIVLSMWLGVACPAMVYTSFAIYSHVLDLLIWTEGHFLDADLFFHSHEESSVTFSSVLIHARGTSPQKDVCRQDCLGRGQRKVHPRTFFFARCLLTAVIVMTIAALLMRSHQALVGSMCSGVLCCAFVYIALPRIPQELPEEMFQRQPNHLEVDP